MIDNNGERELRKGIRVMHWVEEGLLFLIEQ